MDQSTRSINAHAMFQQTKHGAVGSSVCQNAQLGEQRILRWARRPGCAASRGQAHSGRGMDGGGFMSVGPSVMGDAAGVGNRFYSCAAR
jgi:hypothetical protein